MKSFGECRNPWASRKRVSFFYTLLLCTMLLIGCTDGMSREIIVYSTEDSGEGTLRWALEVAGTGDIITFDPEVFIPDQPSTIYVKSELPKILQGKITIDASSAGVIINGFYTKEDVDGLIIDSANNVIQGLKIINFRNGAGISLINGSRDNLIGGINNNGDNISGESNLFQGNRIGVSLMGSKVTDNIIAGNLIGTDINGNMPPGNNGNIDGVSIGEGSSSNIIGEGNIIAYNKSNGIIAQGNESNRNKITCNRIFSNGNAAILLEGSNEGLEPPIITEFDLNLGVAIGTAYPGSTVEIFSANAHEGLFYEGSVEVDQDGLFSYKGVSSLAPRFTATATDLEGNTSEFSMPTAVREFVVNSTEDSGEGTLRSAMQNPRSGDIITFDPEIFPPDAPATIYLESELPYIRENYITIDASNAGVILDGINTLGEWDVGLVIQANNVTIQSLQIINFSGAGIELFGQDNIIGGDRDKGNGPIGQGNLLSNNADGIAIRGFNSAHNQVTGNLIGTDVTGKKAWGNRTAGIFIEQGANSIIIGPANIIAYNYDTGIDIRDRSSYAITITQNSIYQNNHAGIRMERGDNIGVSVPIIIEFDLALGTLVGLANPNSIVEIFSDSNIEGEFYEGCTTTDETGAFTLNKGSSFAGLQITATVTDTSGNTSPFSSPTVGTGVGRLLQAGNDARKNPISTYPSYELADNRIGDNLEAEHVNSHVWKIGSKWIRVIVDPYGQWQHIDWEKDEYSIDPMEERVIDDLVSNSIKIKLVLDVWHPEHRIVYYKTERDIAQYLNWVRFVVRHFKGRIEYYEILNEPDLDYSSPSGMPPNAYIKLIKQTIPIIREEDPHAKIVVGAIVDTRFDEARAYMWELLNSEVMPLVEGFSWHGMYGAAPSDDPRGIRQPEQSQMANYWANYPALVQEIKSVAAANGFIGDFFVGEMLWRTPCYEPHETEPYNFTDASGAKYYARAIMIHLALDVMTGLAIVDENVRPQSFSVVKYLCTIMAGHESVDMPVEIDVGYDGPVAYCSFRYPNGDRMLALWTDGVAQDEDPGVPATITLPGLTTDKVTGIDVLHGLEQALIFKTDGESTIVRDVLVKDYPILIRLNKPTMSSGYEETAGDGFHRLENNN